MVWLIGWMRPSRGERHRQGHIGALGGEPLFECRAAEFGVPRGEARRVIRSLAALSACAAAAALSGGKRAEPAHSRVSSRGGRDI